MCGAEEVHPGVVVLSQPPWEVLTWMPDGRAVLVTKILNDSHTESELWLVPIDGGQPRKMDFDPSNFRLGGVNPDGRQIAFVFVAGENKEELWVLENFLPALNAKK